MNYIKDFFKNENSVNWATVVASFTLAFVAWLYKPSDTVPLYILIMVLIHSMLLILKLIFYSYNMFCEVTSLNKKISETGQNIPHVIDYIAHETKLILIARKSKFFTDGIDVTLIIKKESATLGKCYGTVESIPPDSDIMQIVIVRDSEFKENQKVISRSLNNKSNLENILIYPGKIIYRSQK